MTTPMPPAEPRRPRGPRAVDLPRRVNAMWTLALRRFRSHLHTTDPYTTHEDTDGRTR
jgi:hypothetical protein